MRVPNLVPIGPQMVTCIRPEWYTHTHTHTRSYIDTFLCQTILQVIVVLQPEFAVMREQYMRAGEGFIICYSVIARRSFDEALEYKKLIDRMRVPDTTPIVLVANKCDLEHLRKVSRYQTLPSSCQIFVQIISILYEMSNTLTQITTGFAHLLWTL